MLTLDKAIANLKEFKNKQEVQQILTVLENLENDATDQTIAMLREQLNFLVFTDLNKDVSLADAAFDVLLVLAKLKPLIESDINNLKELNSKLISKMQNQPGFSFPRCIKIPDRIGNRWDSSPDSNFGMNPEREYAIENSYCVAKIGFIHSTDNNYYIMNLSAGRLIADKNSSVLSKPTIERNRALARALYVHGFSPSTSDVYNFPSHSSDNNYLFKFTAYVNELKPILPVIIEVIKSLEGNNVFPFAIEKEILNLLPRENINNNQASKSNHIVPSYGYRG